MQALVSPSKEGIRVTLDLSQLRVQGAAFRGWSQIQTLDCRDLNSARMRLRFCIAAYRPRFKSSFKMIDSAISFMDFLRFWLSR